MSKREWRQFKWGAVYGGGIAVCVFLALIIWTLFR